MIDAIDIKQILDMLPHRYPFILVDRVLDYKDYEFIDTIKNVTINEPFFTGHFPENPIMPGVLILESLAQSAALLSALSQKPSPGHKFIYLFAGLDNVKFKHMVTPGDRLDIHVNMLGNKREFWRMHAEAHVDGKLACSADLMSAVKEIKSD